MSLPRLLLLASALCLIAPACATDGLDDLGELTPPGDGKADDVQVRRYGPLWPPSPSNRNSTEFAHGSATFAEGERFHAWELGTTPAYLTIRIDTGGTFEPVLWVERVYRDASEGVFKQAGLWLRPDPVEGEEGVFELTAELLENWLSNVSPPTLYLTSTDAAGDAQGSVGTSASYTIELPPVPGYARHTPSVRCLDCQLSAEALPAEASPNEGRRATLSFEVEEGLLPTWFDIRHEKDLVFETMTTFDYAGRARDIGSARDTVLRSVFGDHTYGLLERDTLRLEIQVKTGFLSRTFELESATFEAIDADALAKLHIYDLTSQN